MPQFKSLGGVERGKIRCGVVVGIGAITEDLEEFEVGGVFRGLGEGPDIGRVEELGKDEG